LKELPERTSANDEEEAGEAN